MEKGTLSHSKKKAKRMVDPAGMMPHMNYLLDSLISTFGLIAIININTHTLKSDILL
jgi:hypothetical protein